MQLLRKRLTNQDLLQELIPPRLIFSVKAPDIDIENTQHSRLRHYSLRLLPVQSEVCLDDYILENYVASYSAVHKRSELFHAEDNLINTILKHCDSDENLQIKTFWLLRSAAVSMHSKCLRKADTKIVKEGSIDKKLFNLIEALMILSARLILSYSRREGRVKRLSTSVMLLYRGNTLEPLSQDCNSPDKYSMKQKRKIEIDTCRIMKTLLSPFLEVIKAHDDLSVIWSILLNGYDKIPDSSNENPTEHSVELDASSIISSTAFMELEPSLESRTTRSKQKRKKIVGGEIEEHDETEKIFASVNKSKNENENEKVDENENENVPKELKESELESESEYPWRDVTPNSSYLTASTIAILCGYQSTSGHEKDNEKEKKNQNIIRMLSKECYLRENIYVIQNKRNLTD